MLRRSLLLILTVTFQVATFGPPVFGQGAVQLTNQSPTLSRYFDPKSGMTTDEAVAYALTHNADLLATRKEIEAARFHCRTIIEVITIAQASGVRDDHADA